jgi:hypothetical protein
MPPSFMALKKRFDISLFVLFCLDPFSKRHFNFFDHYETFELIVSDCS